MTYISLCGFEEPEGMGSKYSFVLQEQMLTLKSDVKKHQAVQRGYLLG